MFKTHKNKKKNNKSGFAILEFIFYISILVIMVLVVINALVAMTRSFRETTIMAQLQGGGVVMERISREIKQAYSITSISATDLTLATRDQNGANQNVQVTLSGSNINFLENGATVGNLNPPGLSVTALSFTEITTAAGKAIKVSFTVTSTSDTVNRTIDFYNTAVLRGGY